MTASEGVAHWSFACRDLGYSCEWRLRAGSVEEIQTRFRDHARCAHQLADLPTDLIGRVGSAARLA